MKEAAINKVYSRFTQNVEGTPEILFVGFSLRNGRRHCDGGGLKLPPSDWLKINTSPSMTPYAQCGSFDLMLLENIATTIKA